MIDEKLINEVKALVDEVDKTHRYSMSRIYGAYNAVFGTKEQPQSCSSCLIRKVRELKEWLTKIEMESATKKRKPRKKKAD